MGDVINASGRFPNVRPVRSATHKFSVGARVIHRIGHRSEKASFKVTTQLPDGGQGLQYRIRSDRDGHERVAVESALERPELEGANP